MIQSSDLDADHDFDLVANAGVGGGPVDVVEIAST